MNMSRSIVHTAWFKSRASTWEHHESRKLAMTVVSHKRHFSMAYDSPLVFLHVSMLVLSSTKSISTPFFFAANWLCLTSEALSRRKLLARFFQIFLSFVILSISTGLNVELINNKRCCFDLGHLLEQR